jgi:hypothetical protein
MTVIKINAITVPEAARHGARRPSDAVGGRIVTTTIETVRFDRPETIHFRLVRGPVPHVAERFTLHPEQGATRLDYTGELGADFWGLGR